MRPTLLDIDLANASLTGFASNVTGASFTLTANDAGDGLAHRVSIKNDSANDHSGKTVTLVGTDPDGRALTEVVTGPTGSATVESSGYFLTLTSATPSATIGSDTFDIGWVDEACSPTIPLNWRSEVGAAINVDVTGTIDFTVNETFEDVQDETAPPHQNAQFTAITALSAKTADTKSTAAVGATGIQVVVNSYSDGAELQVNVNQAGSH